ncbi:MAG: SIR2 family protein [Bacteroidota bacterium]|nr:SIR2 family protein [Bacteroidota bacterium]
MKTKETTIKEIADVLKNGKKCPAALLIGAGVSASAGIPLLNDIKGIIETKYPGIKNICDQDSFMNYMKELPNDERKKLINWIIEKSKLNDAHKYIAALIKSGFINRVLTSNFDTLLEKALAEENIFPGIYDISASENFKMEAVTDRSIFRLYGHKDRIVILDSEIQWGEHYNKVKKVIEDTIENQTLIVIGYSGKDDPVFNHIIKYEKFNNKLFWVGHKENEPTDIVRKTILKEEENFARYLKGFDADSFFMRLSKELGIYKPKTVKKERSPHTEKSQTHSNNNTYNISQEPRDWNDVAIKIFDNPENVNNVLKEEFCQAEYIKLNKEAQVNESYQVFEGLNRFNKKTDNNEFLANYLYDCAVTMSKIAEKKEGKEKEQLLRDTINKYKETLKIKPDKHEAIYNWGVVLGKISDMKEREERELLLKETIEKYKEVLKIKPDKHEALLNWGNILVKITDFKKEEKEKEKLLNEAIEKNKEALKIKPDKQEALFNWGFVLGKISDMKEKEEKEQLLQESIEKYKEALRIKPDKYKALTNWNAALEKIAAMKKGEEKELLLREEIKKYKDALKIKLNIDALYNWGAALGKIADMKERDDEREKILKEEIDKYIEILNIKPDKFEAIINWGAVLGKLADMKEGTEKEELLREEIEKYKEALVIKPGNYESINNWVVALGKIADMRSGDEKEQILKEIVTILEENIDEVKFSYNLACAYSLMKDKEKAISYLEKCFKNGFMLRNDYIMSDPDLDFIRRDIRVQKLMKMNEKVKEY